MKINYITYDSWWDTDKTILPDLCKEHDVRCFVLNPRNKDKKYLNKEIKGLKYLRQFEQKYRDRDIRSVFKTIWLMCTLVNKIRDKQYVTIFVRGKNPFFLWLFYLMAPHKRTIICTHNFQEHSGGEVFQIVEKLRLMYYRHFDYFLFYSELQHSKFKEAYPQKQGFYLNMPLKDFGNSICGRNCNNVRFLFFGLIKEYKNLKLFIQAANAIKDERAEFIIAGNCDSWEEYAAMIVDKRKFITDIRFINDDEVPDYFCMSDFLVLPYKDATQSGPLLIALNYSLPIIASDIEEFRMIVHHGQNGFLFKNGSRAALIRVFNNVLNMSEEEKKEMRRQQSIERDSYINQYNIYNISNCMKTIFDKMKVN